MTSVVDPEDLAVEPVPPEREVRWEDLGGIAQNLLLAALAERPLSVVCRSRYDGEPLHGKELQEAAALLVGAGLLWFYRIEDGYPDLTEEETERLLADVGVWTCDTGLCSAYGMYLTDVGEAVFPVSPPTPVNRSDSLDARVP
jgi:hypothetical protein